MSDVDGPTREYFLNANELLSPADLAAIRNLAVGKAARVDRRDNEHPWTLIHRITDPRRFSMRVLGSDDANPPDAWGVVFPDGQAVVRWEGRNSQTEVWDDMRGLLRAAGPHEIVWLDEKP